MVKIRLKQFGKKKQKVYRIVVMHSTDKRDGMTIEEIGFYNPLTNPSVIRIDLDKYNTWIKNGAQPTDSVKIIFSKMNTNESK
jgi:small subunit ribosomal protein S16